MRPRNLFAVIFVAILGVTFALSGTNAYGLTRDIYPYNVQGTADSVTVPIKFALDEQAQGTARPYTIFDIDDPIGVDLEFYIQSKTPGAPAFNNSESLPTVRDTSALSEDGDPTLGTTTLTETGTYLFTYQLTNNCMKNLRSLGLLYSVQNYTQARVFDVTVTVTRNDDGTLSATATSADKLRVLRSVYPAVIFFGVDKTITGEPSETPTFTFVSAHDENTPDLGASDGPDVNLLIESDDDAATASIDPDVNVDGPDVDGPDIDGPVGPIGPDTPVTPQPTPSNGQTQVIGEGSNIFQSACLTSPGTYTYTFSEKNDADKGWVYDASVHTVTVNVSYNGTNTLAYECTLDGQPFSPTEVWGYWNGPMCSMVNAYLIPFANTYAPTPASVTLGVNKRIVGGTPSENGTFEFRLSGDCETQTTEVTGAGSNDFAPVTFTQAGTYTLEVTEVAGDEPGYSYDTTTHQVIVTVTDNGGELSATMTVDGAATDDGTMVEFTNTFTTPPAGDTPTESENPTPDTTVGIAGSVPSTGDTALGVPAGALVAVVVAGAAIVIAGLRLQRLRRQRKS